MSRPLRLLALCVACVIVGGGVAHVLLSRQEKQKPRTPAAASAPGRASPEKKQTPPAASHDELAASEKKLAAEREKTRRLEDDLSTLRNRLKSLATKAPQPSNAKTSPSDERTAEAAKRDESRRARTLNAVPGQVEKIATLVELTEEEQRTLYPVAEKFINDLYELKRLKREGAIDQAAFDVRRGLLRDMLRGDLRRMLDEDRVGVLEEAGLFQ